MTREQILNRIKNSVTKEDPTAEIFLYGSRAREDFKKSSDWDILILVNNPRVTNEIEDKFRNPLYDLELDSGEIISVLIYPKNHWNNNLKYAPLYKNITLDGIKL